MPGLHSADMGCIVVAQATKRSRVLSFYTIPEYEEWREAEGAVGWDIKYYKGLGTSTKEEAIEYFSDIDRHRKEFVWEGRGVRAPQSAR